jgi:hypothetical protein
VSRSSICLKTQHVRGRCRADGLELREDSELGDDSGQVESKSIYPLVLNN